MSDNSYKKVVAKNRRASFDYSIEENIEAGIMLTGSELKSIREGKVSLADSHAAEGSGELYLYNCHIILFNFLLYLCNILEYVLDIFQLFKSKC